MARTLSRLSPIEVERLAKQPGDKTRLYHDGGGLYLCVDKRGGSASWMFRYMIDGKARNDSAIPCANNCLRLSKTFLRMARPPIGLTCMSPTHTFRR